MFLIDLLKSFFRGGSKTTQLAIKIDESIYHTEQDVEEIHSVWDYIKLNENTQAFHLSAVLGFEEWISMDEILRRIKELFGMDYKNDRSLYPYIKTLVDIGLVETTNVGGKKRWRKKDILIKVKGEKKEKKKVSQEEKEAQATS